MDCLECGEKDFSTNYIEPVKTELTNAGICHTCMHWAQLYAGGNTPSRYCVVDGTHYHVTKERHGDLWWNGFGGSWFYVKFDDGRLLKSNNVWCQGRIDEHWRSRHQDNARLLSKEEFEAEQAVTDLLAVWGA